MYLNHGFLSNQKAMQTNTSKDELNQEERNQLILDLDALILCSEPEEFDVLLRFTLQKW